MCDDLNAEMATLAEKSVACSGANEQPWGLLTRMTLPGGGTIGLYQPKHPVASRAT